jgi:hypothetical protein
MSIIPPNTKIDGLMLRVDGRWIEINIEYPVSTHELTLVISSAEPIKIQYKTYASEIKIKE